MNQLLAETITNTVKKVMLEESFVEVEASGRHVHLSREAIDFLFGEGYQLTKAKELSQPGQFACKERITIAGPKGKIENVVILGPERKASQVEVSLTDAVTLGRNIPVRESGDIDRTPGITLIHKDRQLELDKGLIAAKRHIHVSPRDAELLKVENKEIVQVKVFGDRSLTFDEVVIRIHPNFRTFMHIDFDEANACGFKKGVLAKIIKKTSENKVGKRPEIQQIQPEQHDAIIPEQEQMTELNQKIITESDLQKLFLKQITKIRIPAGSIITPLANDYVRKHRLEIQRCEEN
ncbi:hypothetical protein GCM10028868_16330 [Virgibacillus kimchii]